tara:strand:- start:807 stop:1166 length:360 start_codon:yes stop_codon:yes gene_type:complete
MSRYIIVIDTLCAGIQAVEEEAGKDQLVKNALVSYPSEELAMAEIMENFKEMNQYRVDSGEEPDNEPEEFVMLLDDYVEGHKTIWTVNSPLTLEGHKYQCYIDNTQEAFPKTFDEWLNS